MTFADFYETALVNGILGVSRLSSDEVLGQEGDNVALIERLLHKATHAGHDHDHAHGATRGRDGMGRRSRGGAALAV